ncbi:hypothetical protein JA1_000715 [Spathaspora sp. JA1]|nr:hypothetical protein JA1_000715 [Spathaspora sp. JA1]
MVKFSVLATVALFSTTTLATTYDVFASLTLPDDALPQPVDVIIETAGDFTVDGGTIFDATSLTVKPGGQFYYRAGNGAGTIEVDSTVNNGFIFYDASQALAFDFPLGNVQNNGELVIQGQLLSVEMELQSNVGQLTFWGSQGYTTVTDGTNSGNICYYDLEVVHTNPDGSGCIALSDTEAYFEQPQSNFNPTFVFEGTSSDVFISEGGQGAQYTLVQFGGEHGIEIPDGGFTGYTYESGIVTFQFSDYQVTFDIGYGYDETLLEIQNDGTDAWMQYGGAVPAGANTGGCSCVLNTYPPPPFSYSVNHA